MEICLLEKMSLAVGSVLKPYLFTRSFGRSIGYQLEGHGIEAQPV